MHKLSYQSFTSSERHTPLSLQSEHSKLSKTVHYLFSCFCLCCCCSPEAHAREKEQPKKVVITDTLLDESLSVLMSAIWLANRTSPCQIEHDLGFTRLQDPNYMLRIHVKAALFQRIGIIRTTDERGVLKNYGTLAEEIKAKVACYFNAKRDPETFILTEDGCAFNRREVKGLMQFEDKLAYQDEDGIIHVVNYKGLPFKINSICSYTFVKVSLKEQIVEMSDDYDKVRLDRNEKEGFFFSVDPKSPKFMQLVRRRADAK